MLGIKLDVKPFLERVGQELLRIDTASVKSLADQIYKRYEAGQFVFIIGNGGSGSNASHFCEDMGKGTIRREDFDNDDKKRLQDPQPHRQHALYSGLGQRRGVRSRLRRTTQEPRQPWRPAHRHQRFGQQPEHPERRRVGQSPRLDYVRLHRLHRRQTADAGPPQSARAARRHGHRRVDPPDGVSLGGRSHSCPYFSVILHVSRH